MLGGDGHHRRAHLPVDLLQRKPAGLGDIGNGFRCAGYDKLRIVAVGPSGLQNGLLRFHGLGGLSFCQGNRIGGRLDLRRRFLLHVFTQVDENGAAGQAAQKNTGQKHGSHPTAVVLWGTDISGLIETAEPLFLGLREGGIFRLQGAFVIVEHKHCLAITDCLPQPG